MPGIKITRWPTGWTQAFKNHLLRRNAASDRRAYAAWLKWHFVQRAIVKAPNHDSEET